MNACSSRNGLDVSVCQHLPQLLKFWHCFSSFGKKLSFGVAILTEQE
jgi:hypothetical protein